MSLMRAVAEAVEAHGPIRTDRLAAMFPGKTFDQVGDAAKNASHKGLVHCARRERVEGSASIGVWEAGPKPDPERPMSVPRGDYGIPKVASVWDLGSVA